MRVTCGIPTKGRYELLAQTLQSVIYQTRKPDQVIIVDDSDQPRILTDNNPENKPLQNLFMLMNYYGIEWEVVFGRRLGQHHSHQVVQEKAKGKIIWRIDDDEVAEPNVLEGLLSHFKDHRVGAVGGLVPQHIPIPFLPKDAENTIHDLEKPNIQWYKNRTLKPITVDHLTSTFCYRKGIEEYELHLSPAAHREETLFTYGIKRKGYRVLIDPTVITWHFRSDYGGIRSHQNSEFWEHDEKIFQTQLMEWGITSEAKKVCVLNCGLGDHIVFKSIIPELKAKYGKLLVASTFPEVLEDDDVEQISIAEAQSRFGFIDRYNIYRRMIDWSDFQNKKLWEGNLQDAFRKLYGLTD